MPLRTFDISGGKPVPVAPGQVSPPGPQAPGQTQQPMQMQGAQQPQTQPQYSSLMDQVRASFGNQQAQSQIKNKPGLDLGDLAGLVGSIPATAGAIGGGILGAAAGPLGSIAGSGAGAGLGESIRAGIGKLLGVQQGTTLGGEAKKIGTEALIGAGTELGGKALTAGAKAIKAVTPAFFSFTTGLPSQVFERAIANPTEVRAGFKTGIDEVIKAGQEGIQSAKQIAQEKYGQVFKTIADEVAASGQQATLTEAKGVAQGVMDDLGIKAGKVNNKYVMSFGTSKIADKGEQTIIKDTLNDLRTWPDRSFTGINTLGQRISNRITEDLSPVTQRALSKIADGVKEQLPEALKQLNKNYAQHTDVLQALETVFEPNSNKTLAMQQAETKLRQMFSQNKTLMQQMINSFEGTTGKNISDNVSGILLSRVQPQVLRGLSALGGSVGGAAAGFASPLLAPLALGATSPRVAGEVVTGASKLAEKLAPGLSKAAPYFKGATMEALRRINR